MLVLGSLIVLLRYYAKVSAQQLQVKNVDQTMVTTTTSMAGSVSSTIEEIPLQFLVTSKELEQAGFSGVQQLQASSNRFKLPVLYFNVREQISVDSAKFDCDDCTGLVAIYITPVMPPTTTPVWANKTNLAITQIAGRIQIKMLVAQRIIYVTTPSEKYGLNLIRLLRERVILNRTLLNDQK